MQVKELKKYLGNFKDNDTVAVSMWDNAGGHYFTINAPVCNPIKFTTDRKEHIAVVGHFDVCQANVVVDPRLKS